MGHSGPRVERVFMDARSNRSQLLSFKRKRGPDTTEFAAGNSMAWLIIAILVIVLTAFGLVKFGPEAWNFLTFGHRSLTYFVAPAPSTRNSHGWATVPAILSVAQTERKKRA